MDVFEACQKRHSYRGPFTDAPVNRDEVNASMRTNDLLNQLLPKVHLSNR